MRSGEQFPFKQHVTEVPWGHPALPAVGLILAPAPVPEYAARYFESIAPARARFAAVGARFELVRTVRLPEPELVLTDGFGEIFARWTETQRASWPGNEELSEWLVYIASQCPECSPAEPAWRDTER